VTGRLLDFWRSQVARLYVAMIVGATLLVSWSLWAVDGHAWSKAFRFAAFQVTSIATSTGFANADSSIWPATAQLILVLLALQCACAGSTSGGIKVDRVLVSLKAVVRQMALARHPKGIISVRLDDRALEEHVVTQSLLYVFLYLMTVVVATLVITALGVDLLSAFSGSVACIGNVGPGLGAVGSISNYGPLSGSVKLILTALMLLGRLEFFALLLILSPSQWRHGASY
jgi:trk system potassium uptake protein TrkH